MKSHYVMHADRGYVESLLDGNVTLPELGLFIQQLWADPGWRPEFNSLIDLSGATIDLDDAELKMLVKSMLNDPRCGFTRWAFVVATAEDFGRLRKFDALTGQETTLRIFFSRSDAEKWLLPPRKES